MSAPVVDIFVMRAIRKIRQGIVEGIAVEMPRFVSSRNRTDKRISE